MIDKEAAVSKLPKQIVFEFQDGRMNIHLGDEDAICKPKEDNEDFDPRASNYDLNFCRFACRVMRVNKSLEKDAGDRLKIYERAQARVAEKIALKEGKDSIAIRQGDIF